MAKRYTQGQELFTTDEVTGRTVIAGRFFEEGPEPGMVTVEAEFDRLVEYPEELLFAKT